MHTQRGKEKHEENVEKLKLIINKLDKYEGMAERLNWITWSVRSLWSVLIIGGVMGITIKLWMQ